MGKHVRATAKCEQCLNICDSEAVAQGLANLSLDGKLPAPAASSNRGIVEYLTMQSGSALWWLRAFGMTRLFRTCFYLSLLEEIKA